MSVPNYMRPLFEECSPHGKPKFYYVNLGFLQCSTIKLNNPAPGAVTINEFKSRTAEVATIRVFKHDTEEDIYYVSLYPIYKVYPEPNPDQKTKRYPFNTRPIQRMFYWGSEDTFEDIPQGMFTDNLEDYLPLFLKSINSVIEEDFFITEVAPNSMETVLFREHKELEGKLYGPFTMSEIIDHMRTDYAYL